MTQHSPASTAAVVAAKVKRARRRFFRRTDFAGPHGAVDRELSRLVGDGHLVRIKRGLYWKGPQTMLGMAPPRDHELLHEVLQGQTYGWTGTSAANRLGLTSQVPGRVQVAVVGRPPRDLDVFEFVQRSGHRERAAARLTPVEVAVLEVLADFEELVESKSAAWERLTALVESGQVRRDALRRVLIDERPIVREHAEALLTDDQSRLLAEPV